MNPLILSDNDLLENGTLTASETDTGFDVLNLIDRRTFTFWQGANTSSTPKYIDIEPPGDHNYDFDTLAIFGHNLHTAGAKVKFEWIFEDGEVIVDWFTPADDKAIIKYFTEHDNDEGTFRLSIASVGGSFLAKPRIAIVMIGKRVSFPFPADTPFSPFRPSIQGRLLNGQQGHHLGSITGLNPISIKANFSNNSKTFVENTFWPWWNTYGKKLLPFFWAADLVNTPSAIFLVSLTANSVFDHPRTIAGLVDVISLDMIGLLEE
jgi:hypothetical protein